MALVTVIRCDFCQGEPAETWLLQQAPAAQWAVDLCQQHSEPLRELRAKGRQAGPVKRRRTGVRKTPLPAGQ